MSESRDTIYTSLLDLLDDAGIEQSLAAFHAAPKVRHLVLDNFLSPQWATQVLNEMPDIKEMPKSRDYVFSNKRELSTLDLGPEACVALHETLVGSRMQNLLSRLAKRDVVVDPEYIGGGFHAGGPGSFLDLHTDFNVHPQHPDWIRAFNLLLYMNPGWTETWGGELQLTDDPDAPPILVAPIFNRLVIMESTSTSFHGYSRISFPAGEERRSIAAYGYWPLADSDARPKRRTTSWTPPDAGLAKRTLARNWNRLVLTKNRFFGSGTVRNRRPK